MDPTSAFKSEIFRPLTTVAIPGAVAFGPFVVITQYYLPVVTRFWKEHDGAFVSIVVICVLAIGLMMENIGALVEITIDKRLQEKDTDHLTNWNKYLSLKLKDEIVGQRYLQGAVLRLKFELAMIPAVLFLGIGLAWIQVIHVPWTVGSFVVLIAFLSLLEVYLVYEAWLSACNLSAVRKVIIAAVT